MKRAEIATLVRVPRCGALGGARRCALADGHEGSHSPRADSRTALVGPLMILVKP